MQTNDTPAGPTGTRDRIIECTTEIVNNRAAMAVAETRRDYDIAHGRVESAINALIPLVATHEAMKRDDRHTFEVHGQDIEDISDIRAFLDDMASLMDDQPRDLQRRHRRCVEAAERLQSLIESA